MMPPFPKPAIRRLRRSAAGVFLCALASGSVMAQQFPNVTELPGKPFFVKQTWTIGGEGNWDYLAFDPTALQLFVAHGAVVQVVDVGAGRLAGEVSGMRDAHGIALDDSEQFGYASDGPANRVRIFDRRLLQVVASVETGPNPRAVVYEPATKLIFAVCTQPLSEALAEEAIRPNQKAGTGAGAGAANRSGTAGSRDSIVKSVVTVIDAETRVPLANLLLPGKLGFAQADGRGLVYINVVDRNQIVSFDAQALEAPLRRLAEKLQAATADGKADKQEDLLQIDWSGDPSAAPPIRSRLSSFSLGPGCREPRALAVDASHLRIFAACENRKLEVLNAESGQVVASLDIGPGTDAIAYDPSRGLIFTANGGGLGSVTVIRQDVTDTYAVIQELPTKQRARTLAVNPATGEVYLVTNLQGFDLKQKGTPVAHDVPVIQAIPVKGSFQVLVVGN